MDVFLISGIPGAGKTTVSRRIAGRFARGVHVEGDAISFDFVVNGGGDPFGDDQARAQFHEAMALRRKHMCMLADSFTDAGFTSAMDDVVVHPDVLALHLRLLRHRPPRLAVLAPPIDVVAARDAGRDKHVFHMWAHLDTELRTRMQGIGLWIEDPNLSPDAVADLILAEAPAID